jgi:DNA-binding CsgD family transcriptional regulator
VASYDHGLLEVSAGNYAEALAVVAPMRRIFKTIPGAAELRNDGGPAVGKQGGVRVARAEVAPTHDLELTPSERRVVELAASGMPNKYVATALFISPKTVEANLGRIYRKLGIKTRDELGRLIGEGVTAARVPAETD